MCPAPDGQVHAVRQRNRCLPALLVTVTLLAAGCSSTAPTATPGTIAGTRPATSAISWGPCQQAGPVDPGAPADPPGTYECARFAVPIDWEKPTGPTIDLALKRRRADDPARRIGSVFFNPGGPGVSGIQRVGEFASKLGPPVTSRFDLVGFDPRGVAASGQLSCGANVADYYALDLTVTGPADPIVAGAQRWAEDCGSSPLLPQVGTNQVVRDLDALRAAVGDERLTFIGTSYGTEIGTVYAERYPEKVRAIILDGVVDISLTGEQSIEGQAGGWKLALDNFFAWCAGADGCELRDDPGGRFASLLDRYRAEPKSVDVEGRKIVVSPTWIALLAIVLAYDDTKYPDVAKMLAAAERGEVDDIAAIAAQLSAAALGPAVYVYCQDFPFQGGAAYQAYTEKLANTYGVAGALDANLNRPCAHWPVPIDPLPRDFSAKGAPTIMVWGTTQDPSTPYANSVKVADQLDKAVLVTLDAKQHTAYGANDCVRGIMAAYLVDADVPPEGTRC